MYLIQLYVVHWVHPTDRVNALNSTSTGSAVVGLAVVINAHTDHAASVTVDRIVCVAHSDAASYSNCGWRRGVVVSGVRRMNEVNARRARLVPGWVTVFGRVCHLGM